MLRSRAEHRGRVVGTPGVDRRGEPADARIGGEAEVALEPDARVVQVARVGRRGRRDRFRRHAAEVGQRVAAGDRKRRVGAQLGEHRARLDGGELVLVAEQHDARAVRHCLEKLGREREVEHRRLVDHERVDREPAPGVVNEAGRRDAEQAVDRRSVARKLFADHRWQVRGALADRLAHARCGLARRRGERDAAARLLRDQAGEQVDDGRRLAGARAAADDGKAPAQRERGGNLLPVERVARLVWVRREQRGELGAECIALRCGDARRRSTRGKQHAPRKPAFVVEVAVQVEPAVGVEHERHRARRIVGADDARCEQRAAQAVDAGRRIGRIEVGERHADMSASERKAHRTRGVGRGGGHIAARAAAQRPRPRMLRKALGEREHRGVEGRSLVVHRAGSSSNSAEARASASGVGRAKWTPAGAPSASIQSGRTPRTKR